LNRSCESIHELGHPFASLQTHGPRSLAKVNAELLTRIIHQIGFVEKNECAGRDEWLDGWRNVAAVFTEVWQREYTQRDVCVMNAVGIVSDNREQYEMAEHARFFRSFDSDAFDEVVRLSETSRISRDDG
jgi:hypothetical protein